MIVSLESCRLAFIVGVLILEALLRWLIAAVVWVVPTEIWRAGYTNCVRWIRIFRNKLPETRPQSTEDFTTAELLALEGIGVEEHTVETEDGFVLMMHRLVPISAANSPTGNTHSPARRNGKAQQQRLPATPDAGTVNGEESVSVSVPSASHLNDKSDTECTGDDTCLPVLMMHGIMMSSEVFVCNAHLSLPVFLFKLGYDVWLANNRGNKYSWMHRTLRRHDPKYWDFSIDELAAYDVPAFVNRVLYLCNTRRLLYIGFSNGTAQMFAALAQDPVLNDKIALFIAMAPACKLQCPQQTWVYTRTPIVDSVCTCICIGAYRHYFASMSSVCWLCVVDSSDPRNRKVARAVAVSCMTLYVSAHVCICNAMYGCVLYC
eukprot:Lankesteria_metandrocarpae@DN4941_c0_g1_i4.p1